MTNILHHTTTTTSCASAELLFDAAGAEAFRALCRQAVGRDCVCEEGKPCPLYPSVRKAGDFDRKTFTVGEASRLTDRSEYEIRNAVNTGELPAVRVGVQLLIRWQDIDEWYGEEDAWLEGLARSVVEG